MNKIIYVLIVLLLSFPLTAFSKDVNVRGYTRSDGTYVRPHVRSAPNSSLSDNYGPSRNDSQLMNPRSRDNDGDGVPNYLDTDDDNDGISDEIDSYQYGR